MHVSFLYRLKNRKITLCQNNEIENVTVEMQLYSNYTTNNEGELLTSSHEWKIKRRKKINQGVMKILLSREIFGMYIFGNKEMTCLTKCVTTDCNNEYICGLAAM